MNVIDLLAPSLNQKGSRANLELAVEIIKMKQTDWVEELVGNLQNKNIQSDCIKVLYEIGERGSGDMIAPYINNFGDLLSSKNNRLVWGAMIALDTITEFDADGIYRLLSDIVKAVDNGSVITIDHGIGIYAKLAAVSQYRDVAFPLLMEQLRKCPAKQLPMYAEKSYVAIAEGNVGQFVTLLKTRMSKLETDSQKKRIQKVVKALSAKFRLV